MFTVSSKKNSVFSFVHKKIEQKSFLTKNWISGFVKKNCMKRSFQSTKIYEGL